MSGGVETVTVEAAGEPVRLDRWFKRHYPALGHGRLEKLLRTGQIRVDGKRARASDRLSTGQAVRIPPLGTGTPRPQTAEAAANPADEAMLRAAILHRDEAVIVLNKPPGLAVQGGSATERHVDALLDGLRFGHAERPRLVHRLDKDTSGLLVIARSAAAAAALARAFRDKATRKIYWAIVIGHPQPEAGRISVPLAKLGGRGGERVRPDAEEGRRAVTYYRVIDAAGDKASWLALMPVTGRTHQLRAHCAAIGAPILGDGKYGGTGAHPAGVPGARRLHLHARALTIPHPQGGTLNLTAPLPDHMQGSWSFFGFRGNSPAAGDPFPDLDITR